MIGMVVMVVMVGMFPVPRAETVSDRSGVCSRKHPHHAHHHNQGGVHRAANAAPAPEAGDGAAAQLGHVLMAGPIRALTSGVSGSMYAREADLRSVSPTHAPLFCGFSPIASLIGPGSGLREAVE